MRPVQGRQAQVDKHLTMCNPSSLHRTGIPSTHMREVQAIFPEVDLTGVLLVPTCQQATVDLVNVGPRIEDEKDRLLERVWFLKGRRRTPDFPRSYPLLFATLSAVHGVCQAGVRAADGAGTLGRLYRPLQRSAHDSQVQHGRLL